jgi:hypothetical protein
MSCLNASNQAAKYIGFSQVGAVVTYDNPEDYCRALDAKTIRGFGNVAEDATEAVNYACSNPDLTPAQREAVWKAIADAKPQKLRWDGSNIPNQVWGLTSLQDFAWNTGAITSVPKEVGQLAQLRHLDLSGNRITADGLPVKEILKLKALTSLDLRNNDIGGLPPELFNLSISRRGMVRHGGRIWGADAERLYASKVAPNVAVPRRAGRLHFEKVSSKKYLRFSKGQVAVWGAILAVTDKVGDEFEDTDVRNALPRKPDGNTVAVPTAALQNLVQRGILSGGQTEGVPGFYTRASYKRRLTSLPSADDYMRASVWAEAVTHTGTLDTFQEQVCLALGDVHNIEELTAYQQLAVAQAFYCIQPPAREGKFLVVVKRPDNGKAERVLLNMSKVYVPDNLQGRGPEKAVMAKLFAERPDLFDSEGKSVICEVNEQGNVIKYYGFAQ